MTVQELFARLAASVERAKSDLGATHVLVPLEPWSVGDEPAEAVTLTGRGHLVSTGAGKQVPALAAPCVGLHPEGTWVVGRSSRTGVEIDQPTVSRLHAELRGVGGVFSVRDRGSYNGTMINDRVLEQGETRALRNGDVVVFGEAQLVFGELGFLADLIAAPSTK